MITELERRLARFVDRDSEIRRFCALLQSEQKPIMVVWGDSGIGKSSLFLRMVHECGQRKLRKAEVICKDGRANDYLEIMRKIRDDVGVDHFRSFTDLISFLTEPGYQSKLDVNVSVQGNIQVASGATIGGSSVGNIAGIIIDKMYVDPRPDMAIPPAERMLRLTKLFIASVNAAAAVEPLVIFLDAVEKMPAETERWLWGELLDAVRQGEMKGVKFVVCGQKPPQLDSDWRMLVEEAHLNPLKLEHIVAYLGKRGVDNKNCQVLGEFLFANTKGRISEIAGQVDAFLKMREQVEEADG